MSTTHRRLAWTWLAVGGVASTTPRGGTLPFTGGATWPLLLTGVALLSLGVASLMAARWRYDRLKL
jgi:hypothetical protein